MPKRPNQRAANVAYYAANREREIERVKAVMSMISNFGLDRILAEVAKCDIVCANCHRLRTFERRQAKAA